LGQEDHRELREGVPGVWEGRVYDAPAENVIQKGNLMPGKILLVDTEEQMIIKLSPFSPQ